RRMRRRTRSESACCASKQCAASATTPRTTCTGTSPSGTRWPTRPRRTSGRRKIERGGACGLALAARPQAAFSRLLEHRLVDLVLGDLRRDAAPRQPANLGAAADVAVTLLQRLADVLLLDVGADVAQQLRQRRLQVDDERLLRGAGRQHVGR